MSLLNHYKHIYPNDPEAARIPTDEERLLFMIRKESKLHTIHYLNWLNSTCSCIVDFDKLMGSRGGAATDADAMLELRKIAYALKLEASDDQLEKIYKKHWGTGWSFFKGKSGVWKDYFTEEHKRAIKEEIGDMLIELGFETSHNW